MDSSNRFHGMSADVRSTRNCPDVFDEFRREAVGLRAKEDAASLPRNGGLVGIAKPGRRFNERLEHRLQIEGRAADDLEHVGGRGLLLERLPQLVEQPRVLDGNDSLCG